MDKILFILAIPYKSLHMVLGSGGYDETGWKPSNIPSQYGLCLGEVDAVRRGRKEIKPQKEPS